MRNRCADYKKSTKTEEKGEEGQIETLQNKTGSECLKTKPKF